MEMTPEQLKKLAEWYYPKDDKTLDWIEKGYFAFVPHLDSNQLDILEDKMIKELLSKSDFVRLEIYADNKQHQEDIFIDSGLYNQSSMGKTKNEARLNAILKHIEVKN